MFCASVADQFINSGITAAVITHSGSKKQKRGLELLPDPAGPMRHRGTAPDPE
jgi:hypothetical protein